MERVVLVLCENEISLGRREHERRAGRVGQTEICANIGRKKKQ